MRRVAVTGVGLTSPVGNDLDAVAKALRQNQHGIRHMKEWEHVAELHCLLGAVADVDLKRYSRKKTRTMGRVSLLSTYATERAIDDSGLDEDTIRSGATGLCYGSTQGSTIDLEAFTRTLLEERSLASISGTAYLKFMSHTCAANLAQFFGITGRVIPTVAACASASQAIGLGYEAIRNGQQDVMICGGAEELHFIHAGVFDLVFAASTKYNDRPELTPRPFDVDRDGLVVGEGAGTLVLEDWERAAKRGAHIHAEVIGFGMSCDGTHVTAPSDVGMSSAMRLCLQDAKLAGSDVHYINAHGTGTELGDVVESRATESVVGSSVPFSSTKGYTGHTLGACGAIEAAFCFVAMRDGFLPLNRNLERVDAECGKLDFIMGEHREARARVVMSNNFAFGGINTSLAFKQA